MEQQAKRYRKEQAVGYQAKDSRGPSGEGKTAGSLSEILKSGGS